MDLQLRGRAGRQGDPGESRVLREPRGRIARALRGCRPYSGAVHARAVGRADSRSRRPPLEAARAQRIVEGQNYEIRQTLGPVRGRARDAGPAARCSVARRCSRPRLSRTSAVVPRAGGLAAEAASPAVVLAQRAGRRSRGSIARGAAGVVLRDLREGIPPRSAAATRSRTSPGHSRVRADGRAIRRGLPPRTARGGTAASIAGAGLDHPRPRPTRRTTTRSRAGASACC